MAAPAQQPDAPPNDQLLLAATWHPAFCETAAGLDKPECQGLGPDAPEAGRFSLHGLWPQPFGAFYCGVDPATAVLSRDRDWDQLPPLTLPADLAAALARVMPGTQSHLDRHEWIKHGTCYPGGVENYYRDSVQVLADLNATQIDELFRARVGQTVSLADVEAALGAEGRVQMVCRDLTDGRRAVVELRVALQGPDIAPDAHLAALIAAADPIESRCVMGLVDGAG